MDVTAQTFAQAVLEPSYGMPVVVDFYATWCGPCQILKPMLERLTQEYGIALAKVDIDQNPELASQYQVQGVPDVRVFREGQAQPGFVGAPAEAQVREFLQNIGVQSELQGQLAEVERAIAAQDYPAAKTQLDDLFAQYPNQPQVTLLAAKLLIALDQLDDAARLLKTIAPNQTDAFAQAQMLGAQLELQRWAQAPLDSTPLAQQYQQAAQAAVHQNYEAALQDFLAIVERDRTFGDDGARKAMLTVFKLLGANHPLTQQYQQDLMLALY
ncbi:MAG: tetratricopeptide repeat protein [Spirulina sp. SIO3F2]|nr:tetratricopeptide repeat protein [Spirulina sp. SIO3F2]